MIVSQGQPAAAAAKFPAGGECHALLKNKIITPRKNQPAGSPALEPLGNQGREEDGMVRKRTAGPGRRPLAPSALAPSWMEQAPCKGESSPAGRGAKV